MTGGDRRTTFVDDSTNAEMHDRGYAVLSARLSPTTVASLAELYGAVVREVGRDGSGAFSPSMTISEPSLRARLWDGVRRLTAAVVEPLFAPGGHELIGGSFVAKPSSPNSGRLPHQDPSIFDEEHHACLSLWISLCDSTVANGALCVLPGSHHMGNHVRPPDVDSLSPEVSDVALAEAIPVESEAGEIIAVDTALVHHSPPNRSDEERVAAICAIRPAGAEMRRVQSQDGAAEGIAEIYETGMELYRSGNLIAPDLGSAPLVGRAPYRPATMADLERSRGAHSHTAGQP